MSAASSGSVQAASTAQLLATLSARASSPVPGGSDGKDSFAAHLQQQSAPPATTTPVRNPAVREGGGGGSQPSTGHGSDNRTAHPTSDTLRRSPAPPAATQASGSNTRKAADANQAQAADGDDDAVKASDDDSAASDGTQAAADGSDKVKAKSDDDADTSDSGKDDTAAAEGSAAASATPSDPNAGAAQPAAWLLALLSAGQAAPAPTPVSSPARTTAASAATTAIDGDGPAAGSLQGLFSSLATAAGQSAGQSAGQAAAQSGNGGGAGQNGAAALALLSGAAGAAAPADPGLLQALGHNAATRFENLLRGEVVPVPTATPLPSANTPLALHTPGWVDQLGTQVQLLLNDGTHEARIELNPKDLGSIQIHIKVGSDGADVRFAAAHPEARQALETSLPRLRELFAADGLALAQAQVGSQFQQHQGQRSFAQSQATPGGDGGDGDEAETAPATLAPVRVARLSLVDHYA